MDIRTKYTSRMLSQAAIIAAIYCALTAALSPLSFGIIQVRFAELLTILPCYTAAAVPGLFVGCALANLVGLTFGLTGLVDIFVGSAATLAAAILTRKLRKSKAWALLPPVIINALLIGAELKLMVATDVPFWLNALSVGLGEAVACYLLGLPISLIFNKYKNRIN